MSDTVIPDPLPEAPPRSRWRRWLLFGAVAAVAAAVGAYFTIEYLRDRELREAVAEADRLDPGWRFDALEAARADVPDGENGATLVLSAAAKKPGGWLVPAGAGPGLDERLGDVALPARPDDDDVKQLRAELGKVPAALDVARDLADRPRGRYTVAWSSDLISTMMPHVQQAREVAIMLSLDALRRALDGDADGALRSCRAVLNAGRSLGDEPALISQIVRASCARLSVRSVERVLAYAEASPKSLEDLQRAFADEAEEPCQLTAARAERAMRYTSLAAMRAGKVNRQTFGMRSTPLGPTGDVFIYRAQARACQAECLRLDTEMVEIARRPPEEQQARLKALAPPAHQLPVLLRALSGEEDGPKMAWAFQRAKAELCCAATALATERYRLAKGRWPERLDELVPDYLPAVPGDPFDGKPLRLRRMDDGIMIYSIGTDGVDNGGNLDRKNETAPGVDLGVRLWDADRRK